MSLCLRVFLCVSKVITQDMGNFTGVSYVRLTFDYKKRRVTMQLLSDSIDLTRYCTLHLFEVYLNTFAKVHLLFSEPSNKDEYFLANGSIYQNNRIFYKTEIY